VTRAGGRFRTSIAALGCSADPSERREPTSAPAPPRLILLYAPCTVSRSYLAPYASDVAYTPQLAAFARESVVFERHQSEAALSGIAYASIFAGSDVTRHRVYSHPRRLSGDVYHIAEAFTDAD
jgi:arylsulfatase A-like enzyme